MAFAILGRIHIFGSKILVWNAVCGAAMVSYETLKRAAIYGAVLSVSGCSVLYYLIQSECELESI